MAATPESLPVRGGAAALRLPLAGAVRADASRWALLAALVVLPLYPKVGLASVEGTYIPLRIDDLVIAGLGAVWVAGLMGAGRAPALPPAWRAGAAWLACGLVALAVGGLVLGTVGLGRGLLFWAKPLEYVLLGWIAYDLGRQRDLLRPVLAVAGAAAAVVVAYGLAQWVGVAPDSPTYRPSNLGGVVSSTMGDPHELAMYLGVVMLVAVGAWAGLGREARLVAAGVLVGGAVALAATGGRSEFVALAVLVAAMLLPRRTRAAAVIALAGLAVALAVSGLRSEAPARHNAAGREARFGNVGNRLATPLSADVSLRERFDEKWPALLRRGMRDPAAGLGPSAAAEGADGYYVRSFVEVGILGTALFAWFLLAIALALARAAWGADPLRAGVALGLLGAVGFLAATGVLLDTWVASRPMQVFWPLAGACLAGGALSRSSARSSAAARTTTAP